MNYLRALVNCSIDIYLQSLYVSISDIPNNQIVMYTYNADIKIQKPFSSPLWYNIKAYASSHFRAQTVINGDYFFKGKPKEFQLTKRRT